MTCFCRVPAIVIVRMGRWNIDIQHSNYVTDTPVQGLLAAGGFEHGGEFSLTVLFIVYGARFIVGYLKVYFGSP